MNTFLSTFPFWIDALAVLVVAALGLSLVGFLMVLRRSLFVPLTIAQTGAFGVTVAFFVSETVGSELAPFPFALAAALGASLLFARRREGGSVAEALLFIAASAGTLLLGSFLRGDIHDVQGVLFGNAVLVGREETVVVTLVTLCVVGVYRLFYHRFLAASFDPETYAASGKSPYRTDLFLYALLSVLIAVSARAIGSLPVFAFAVLPALTALLFTRSLRAAMAAAAVVAVFAAIAGFAASWCYELPTGASVAGMLVLLYGGSFLFIAVAGRCCKRQVL